MSFLPDDYKAPKQSSYFKMSNGDHKVRILSKPILGWVDWGLDDKPIRIPYSPKAPRPVNESKPAKHFWAFIIWNYAEEKIQIWEVTQATIRSRLEELSQDKEWGPPFFYDLKVSKSGEGQKTKYSLLPLPGKPLSMAIINAFEDTPCYLEALYKGANPFEPQPGLEPTQGIFVPDDLKKPSAFTNAQSADLSELEEHLIIDGIAVEYLQEYIDLRAKEKKLSPEQVISGALVKEVLPKFKSVYKAWVKDTKGVEAEAVPF